MCAYVLMHTYSYTKKQFKKKKQGKSLHSTEITKCTFFSTQLLLVSESENKNKLCHEGEKAGLRIEALHLNLDSPLY